RCRSMYHSTTVDPSLSFFLTTPPAAHLYTLSLHDALPICPRAGQRRAPVRATGRSVPTARCQPLPAPPRGAPRGSPRGGAGNGRSEEHTSELQSPDHLVCRRLLEKKMSIQGLCEGCLVALV